MPYGIAAKPQEYDKLWSYIGWLNRGNVVLNRNGEALHQKFASVEAVANYCRNGGVYVDYCGWAMYYDSVGGAPSKERFRNFLRAAGADPNYWDGFAHVVIPYPGFPYRRAWVSPVYLRNATYKDALIMASYEAPSAVYPSPERAQRWFYTAVAVRVGRGWYFYGTGDVGSIADSRASVSPEAYARLIKLLVSSEPRPEPPSGPGCNPDACTSEPVLRIGTYDNNCVGWVQKRLTQLGYDPGPVDCDFGPRTEAAVRQFQKDHGLVADGVVGPQTWRALKSASTGQEPGPGGGEQGSVVVPEPVKPETDWKLYLIIGGAAAAFGVGVYLLVRR